MGLLHSILRLLNCLPQFLECFFGFLAVLDKRQILFFEFSKYVEKLLGVSEK